MNNTNKFVILIVFLFFLAFIWYELRPAYIRRGCAIAMEKGIDELIKVNFPDYNNPSKKSTNNKSKIYDELDEYFNPTKPKLDNLKAFFDSSKDSYELCLRKKGLQN